jgi:hypothetical protein
MFGLIAIWDSGGTKMSTATSVTVTKRHVLTNCNSAQTPLRATTGDLLW